MARRRDEVEVSSGHCAYDAILITSFGGPERTEDVLPFLERTLRGKNVPRERLMEVAHHYYQFGGVSPLNAQIRELIQALKAELEAHGPRLPVYWGNRNWHPFLSDAVHGMREDGIQKALAFVTSPFSSYSSCRQYQEDIVRARRQVGEGAPQIDKLRAFFNHPGFIQPQIENLGRALAQMHPDNRAGTHLLFTAHSISRKMAAKCVYEDQLLETCRLVAEGLHHDIWQLVYQSRSGSPREPWLEPDICDYLRELGSTGVTDVVVAPIGFISDHMEVKYDLDTEARALCERIGLNMVRAQTPGTHPLFVRMIRDLVVERLAEDPVRPALGIRGPSHDVCPPGCCL
ncbi:MAG: ferrochelatase [Acidobacteriota bacterium]